MCNYLYSTGRPCSTMCWTNTVGNSSQKGMQSLCVCGRGGKDGEHTQKDKLLRERMLLAQHPFFSTLPVLQRLKVIAALFMLLFSAPRPAVQWCNLNSSANFDSCDPYHHKAAPLSNVGRFVKAAGHTVSFPSLAMTSDPAQLNMGFPTRKSVQ